MSAKRYTKEQIEYIKANYLKYPVKTIARKIGGSYTGVKSVLARNGLNLPRELVEKRKKDSYFKKGSPAFNKGKRQSDFMTPQAIERTKKTRFKKGNVPHNTKCDGAERITKDGYIEIRVKKGKYRLKHLFLYEKTNGKLPHGSCLRCIDGNKLNTSPENWKLISREENMLYNSKMNYPQEIVPSMALVSKLSKKINILENGE